MRLLFLMLGVCLSTLSIGQVTKTDELKLSIAFGSGVQMAFDGVDRKYKVFVSAQGEHLENGDDQFYKSRYKQSINEYYREFENLVGSGKKGGPIDVFKISRGLDNRYTKPEVLLRRIGSSTRSPDQWMILASAINNLGIYNQQIGNLVVAEKLFTKALEIRGQQAGKTSEHYVSSLHNLAVLRIDQGRYNAAEDILKYVIRYYEKTKTKNSYQYAVAVNNQAMLYVQLGRMPEASALLNEILNNSATIFPSQSFDPARIMTNKALIEIDNKNYDEASDLLTKALKVYEEKELTDLSDYHQIRLQLAQLYLLQGKLTSLNEFIDQTLEEIGKDTGTDNLPYSYALEIKAEYLFETKEYQKSFDLFQQIATIRAAKLGVLHKDYLRAISRQAICQWKLGLTQKAFENFKNTTNSYLEVVDKFFYNMSEKEKARFWQTLNPELDIFYSFMLDQYKSIPELLPLAYNLRLKTKGLLLHNSNQVRDAIYSQPGDSLIAKYEDWLSVKQILSGYYSMDKEMIEIMEADVDGLEAESNELEKELNRLVAGGLLGVEKERITYQDVTEALQKDQVAVEIMRVSNAYGGTFSTDQYVAFVLKKGAQPSLVVIGDAMELESKMSVYYKNAVTNRISESLTYKKFWAPLQEVIGETKHVIISPDGVYNLINPNSLKNEKDQYLIDLLVIDIVPNTKLIARQPIAKKPNSEFVLIGNPTFGSPSINPLPGTAKELTGIKELLVEANTKVFSENLATEESLKEINKPKVLHIATHGFFLGEAENSNTSTITRSLRLSNPLLRSGLLLTGAGKIPSKELSEATSDGIFTAYDAMNLKLQNTDLVVLSACETGTGEVVNGEGVYGLSRAFTIAGAQSLVMSLWKVDDQATMELMKLFYKDWLETKDIKSSFSNAQKQLKEKYKDPYYWAAFVLINN